MTPEDFLADLLAEAADVEVRDDREYKRNGVTFCARTDADAFELRLGPDIAEAARRTPDTQASSRGNDWVRFAPSAWDDHARDRLEAWFRVAWRSAADRPGK